MVLPSSSTATRTTPVGVGLGLRWEFIDELLARGPLELVGSLPNYMGRGGYYPAALERAAERYAIITHGLTLSLGGADPIDPAFRDEPAASVRRVASPWHSDHLCFGGGGGRVVHDLLPIALTQAMVERVSERVRRVEDRLAVPMAVENISFYVHPGRQTMPEPEFVAAVCERADCKLLLDVNNAYVNARNFGVDVDAWLRTVPLERVAQIHVAGHEVYEPPGGGSLLLDTHGAEAPDPCWLSSSERSRSAGPRPVRLEAGQQHAARRSLGEMPRDLPAPWWLGARVKVRVALVTAFGLGLAASPVRRRQACLRRGRVGQRRHPTSSGERVPAPGARLRGGAATARSGIFAFDRLGSRSPRRRRANRLVPRRGPLGANAPPWTGPPPDQRLHHRARHRDALANGELRGRSADVHLGGPDGAVLVANSGAGTSRSSINPTGAWGRSLARSAPVPAAGRLDPSNTIAAVPTSSVSPSCGSARQLSISRLVTRGGRRVAFAPNGGIACPRSAGGRRREGSFIVDA